MRSKIASALFLVGALSGPLFAQANLRVNPYPVPYPSFSAGSENGDFSISYVNTSVSVGGGGSNLSLNGAALGTTFRKGISDKLGWDAQLSIIPEFGSTSGSSLYLVGVPLSTNIEYQLLNGEQLGATVFGGPHIDIVSGHLRQTITPLAHTTADDPTGTGELDSDNTAILYGIQFGGQLSIALGSSKLVPFLMFTPEWGSYTDDHYSFTQGNFVNPSTSLPGSVMTTFGAQLFFNQNFAVSLTYQTAPSASSGGTSYPSFHNLLVGLNFGF